MFPLLFFLVCAGFVAVVYKVMGWVGVAGVSLMCGFTAYIMRVFR